MRRSTHKQSPAQTVVQIMLLASTLGVIVATQALIKSEAQGSCVVPFRYSNPIEGSWAPGTTVTVKVDDRWAAAEQQAFGGGTEKWNASSIINCSAVNFTYSGSIFFEDDAATEIDPPDGSVWFVKRRFLGGEGVVANHGGVPRRTISAHVYISPDRTNVDNTFVYLGTHEMGHTLGLENCICQNGCSCQNGQTIMGGHSANPAFNAGGPTTCDITAVGLVYCPTPTPVPPQEACSTPPDFFGNCPAGHTGNGCNGCCPDAERDECTSSGGYWYV